VSVGVPVRDYLVRLALASRSHRRVTLGLSPRGLLIWQRLAQAHAFLDGRDFATPDDVQDVAIPLLEVRLGIEPEATSHVLAEVLSSVAVPVDGHEPSGPIKGRRAEPARSSEENRHAR
jgi:MoxR-like ATPase